MARRMGWLRNWPTLFWMGAMASARYCGFQWANSPLPEGFDDRVGDPAREHLPIGSVREKPLEREEGRAGHFQQCEQRVAEDVLQPRPPTVAVELLEGGDDAGGNQRALCAVRAGKRVERQREVAVAGIEQDNIVRAVRRDGIQDRFGKIAVGIDERQPTAGGDVGGDKLAEQRGLAHAGLADDGQVPAAVVACGCRRLPCGCGTSCCRARRCRVRVRRRAGRPAVPVPGSRSSAWPGRGRWRSRGARAWRVPRRRGGSRGRRERRRVRMAADGRRRNVAMRGSGELAEGTGDALDLRRGPLGRRPVARRRRCGNMHLEEMPPKLVGGGLKVVLAVVGASRYRN